MQALGSILKSKAFAAGARVFHSTWLRPFNDPSLWRGIARSVNPGYRAAGIGARVVEIIAETADTKTYVLQTNSRRPGTVWPGHRAGQHITLSLTIQGRTLSRVFSIASAPSEDGKIALTIKRKRASAVKAGSRISVSAWMFTHLEVGAELTVSPPEGSFFLENQTDEGIYLLSAGSGITPVMAMLRSLAQHTLGAQPDSITFIHVCKRRSEWIFATELAALAKLMPTLVVHVYFSDAEGTENGRFDLIAALKKHPDLRTAPLYLCGPSRFAGSVCDGLHAAGRLRPINQESFGGDAQQWAQLEPSYTHPLKLHNAKQSFTVSTQNVLLESLENLGLNPAFGCRIGICKACQCLKRSGTVKNLRTGELQDAPNEWIQLCVSSPRSALELAL